MSLSDFQVVCDERVNPPQTIDRNHFTVEIQTPKNRVLKITVDEDGNPVAFNDMPVKYLFLGQ